jgi:predicted nucleotidyltransferase
MAFARITVTLPQDLVDRADRLARQRRASRSAVLAQALHAYVTPLGGVARPGLVREPGAGAYGAAAVGPPVNVSDGALLAELQRRLAGVATPAAGQSQPSGGVPNLHYDRARLAALCRRHRIRRLSLFGSVLRDDFGPQSDVDVLVEFEPGHTPGLAISDIEDELSVLFNGRRVDLVTEKSLHRLIRARVLATALVQYAA